MKMNYIGGEWLSGATTVTNINPSNLDDIIGEYAQASTAQAIEAIEIAAKVYPQWSNGSLQHRADALDRVAAEILARRDELADLLAREEGKTRQDALSEVVRAGHIFRFFAGEAVRMHGEGGASVRQDINVEVSREPIGVVGIVTPWNFPIAIPAWKIAPALAYGNCVVFKPAELVPASAWALAEIISRAGFPPGVFNLVMGPGRHIGQAIADHPAVQAVTFTGSTTTGQRILQSTSQRLARVQLEMGGKNPLVILDDSDLDTAIACALNGAYFSTGQRCTASSRLIVERRILPRFVEGLRAGMRKLVVDDARKPGTDIGPVVDESQLHSNLSYVQIGKDEGATLVEGGQLLQRATRGHYMEPTLFVGASSDMRIAKEEIFGPIACILEADDYEHALSLANDTEFGLSAGICTQSLKHATHFKRHVKAGMVMVNTPTAGVDYHVPFGGRKGSSYGPREQGSHAIEFFTVLKTAYTAS